jgi:hypothetical protein
MIRCRPGFNSIEFEGIRNCGVSTIIKNLANRLWFNPVEFDEIKNAGKHRFTRFTL